MHSGRCFRKEGTALFSSTTNGTQRSNKSTLTIWCVLASGRRFFLRRHTDFASLHAIPFVLLSNSEKFAMCDTVGNDSRSGMRLALERYTGLVIAVWLCFVSGSMRSGANWRAELFREFHREKGMPVSPENLLESDFGVSSTSSFNAARRIMNEFLDRPVLPTAIFLQMTSGAGNVAGCK